MRLPRYPEYKDSGVAWLGNVPAQWVLRPLKAIARGDNGTFIDGDWIESRHISDEGIRYITTGNVGAGFYKEQGTGYISEETFTLLGCTDVLPGDVLISRLNAPIGRACLVPDLGSRIVTSVDNVIVRPSKQIDKRFLVYRLSSPDYFHEAGNIASGATMQRISRTELGNIRIALPPTEEQTAIATFLDRETAKIDALIAEQEKLIALLAEKRQATISHAVTKGLNPDAPMKGSGVDWLGKVPAHWLVTKTKFISSRISSGKTPLGGSEVYVEEGVAFLRSQNVYDDGLRLEDIVYISSEVDESMASSRVIPGDILLNITGASIGRSCVVPVGFETANVNQHVCAIRLVERTRIEFVGWFFKSLHAKTQIDTVQSGAAREGLNFQQIGDMCVPIPPPNEQVSIVGFLDAETTRLDALTTEATRGIALLKERRSALISAAVTGQIDVRNAAPI